MTIYYVGAGGNDASAGTSWALRKLTLNGAEDIPVAAGDTVYVGAGVYREMLTCDASGAAGQPITYIGDYDGAHTDGVGGVVRITGSDDDITAARDYAINVKVQSYRTFRGFLLDSSVNYAVVGTGTDCTLEQCAFEQSGSSYVYLDGGSIARWTINACQFGPQKYNTNVITLRHSSAVDNSGHVIENCVMTGPPTGAAIYIVRVGGVTIRNNLIIGSGYAIMNAAALTAGQIITVNNCIIHSCTNGLATTVLGEIIEDYNCLSRCNTARTNVSDGAHSNTHLVNFDMRWFFQLVGGGKLVTPFDLGQWSQLIDVAGTSPTAADMRGTTVKGTQREWGPLEYDTTLMESCPVSSGTRGRLIIPRR